MILLLIVMMGQFTFLAFENESPRVVNALFNYKIEARHVLGRWNESGLGDERFNFPSHVFVYEDVMLISDTENGRVVVVNRTTWNTMKTITPHQVGENNSEPGKHRIYQTVLTNDGFYYSLIENGSIIQYLENGTILNLMPVPADPTFRSPELMGLCVDNTLTKSRILVKSISSVEIYEYETVIHSLVDSGTRNADPWIKIYHSRRLSSYMSCAYDADGHPLLLEQSLNETTGEDETMILGLGQINDDNYTITKRTPLPRPSPVPADFVRAWVNFSDGMWFSSFDVDPDGGKNVITDRVGNYAGKLSQISGLGLVPGASSLWHDAKENIVIAVFSSRHVIIGMQLFNIVPETVSTIPSDDADKSTWQQYPWWFPFGENHSLVTALIPVIGITIFLTGVMVMTWMLRKRQSR